MVESLECFQNIRIEQYELRPMTGVKKETRIIQELIPVKVSRSGTKTELNSLNLGRYESRSGSQL